MEYVPPKVCETLKESIESLDRCRAEIESYLYDMVAWVEALEEMENDETKGIVKGLMDIENNIQNLLPDFDTIGDNILNSQS